MPRSQSWKQAELFDAVKAGRINIVKQLIAAGVDVNDYDPNGDFLISYALNNYDMAKLLIDAGADIDLIYMIYENNGKIIKLLVDNGANLNKYDEEGYFPLFAAYDANNFRVFKYLLQHGANPNMRYRGETLLRLMMDNYNGKEDNKYIQLLMDYGAK